MNSCERGINLGFSFLFFFVMDRDNTNSFYVPRYSALLMSCLFSLNGLPNNNKCDNVMVCCSLFAGLFLYYYVNFMVLTYD